MAFSNVISSPDMLKQEILRDHPPDILREIGQKAIFRRGERDFLPGV